MQGACLEAICSTAKKSNRWGQDKEGRWKRKRMSLNSRTNCKEGACVEGSLMLPASVL